jgi:hypothetical protein
MTALSLACYSRKGVDASRASRLTVSPRVRSPDVPGTQLTRRIMPGRRLADRGFGACPGTGGADRGGDI